MNLRNILFALASVAFSGLSTAQSTPAPEPLGIAGVRLGMTADEVRAVLKARKYPMREFQATLSYMDKVTQLPVHIPDSIFINTMVQTGPRTRGEPVEKLRVYFSPAPGNERVVAVSHHVEYPRGREVREAALQKAFADKYGELPRNGARCRVNFSVHPAETDSRDPKSPLPPNYVLANHDRVLDLVRNDCGPQIIEIDWNTRDPSLPPEQRVVEEHTVSIVSVQLADESLLASSKTIAEAQQRRRERAAQRASAGGKPERR
jgi:hypothetical protein